MAHLLLLLRHAKSSWDDPALADHDRPLAKRGRRAAELIGEHLRAAGLRPGLVICSPSRRTRETLELLSLDGPEVRLEDAVYEASEEELATVVGGLPEAVQSVLLIGHNPSMGDLAGWLSGQDRTEAASRLREKFPTGALAVFETDETWRDLASGDSRLVSFRTPRDLAG
ncbi:MAG TPA: histidine phosphatase family protein [Pseudonocardia sp.]|uniref:SixA phosphatase family protein n=1 Tax=Pseudonocardia sp. TaxID=60912 RepID=UPI002C7AEABC|nr:histidine phosphatase family protein [Pseudonocardia sp.]HTF50683.1 histidine phosphatase family protein [Pseudonocardia sp.]